MVYNFGAKAHLEGRNCKGGDLTWGVKGTAGENGTHRLPVDREHEDEVCEVGLVKSNMEGCKEVSKDTYLRKRTGINLTSNKGIATPFRTANPLGFMKNEPLPKCTNILRELGKTTDGIA